MSEREDNSFNWLAAGIIMLTLVVALSEIDSWVHRSQIRDLQRRVGQLEERTKR